MLKMSFIPALGLVVAICFGAISKVNAQNYRSGLEVGVCQLPDKYEDARCPGLPSATFISALKSTTTWDEGISNKQTLAIIPRNGQPFAMNMSGLMRVTENGRHVFQLNMRATGYTSYGFFCKSEIWLNDKLISSNRGEMDKSPFVSQGTENLAPGIYKFLIAWGCEHLSYFDHLKNIALDVSFAGPNDRSLHPIPADRIFFQE